MKTPPLPSRKSNRRSLHGAALAVVLVASSAAQPNRDGFHWLGEQNKASVVMLAEQGIITRELGAKIANTIAQVMVQGDKPGAERSRDYLVVEQAMIAIGGPDMTRVHSGRSRQDLGQTTNRLFLRDALLESFGRFIEAREALVRLAEANSGAIVPFYTHGVQAQPTTFGHYLGGYLQAFSRGADRYRQAWARLNLSPLGGAAGGTSSFAVNRARLAELLGFDGLVLNSFDSGQISQMDLGAELASIASSIALTIGMLAADVTDQYSFPEPWITLKESGLAGERSSIMPQKRNPIALERLHLTASTVTGEAVTYFIQCTNVRSGMGDYKSGMPIQVTKSAGALYRDLASLVKNMIFDPKRALDEVNSDYSVATELADVLQRDADVPFRAGHHFASEIVSYARPRHLKPAEMPYSEAARLYHEVATSFKVSPTQLPLSEAQFRRALTAENMVASASVSGGPQPSEVARMLAAEKARLNGDREWLEATRERLQSAALTLDAAVARLRNPM